jgi:hypothetical protein
MLYPQKICEDTSYIVGNFFVDKIFLDLKTNILRNNPNLSDQVLATTLDDSHFTFEYYD